MRDITLGETIDFKFTTTEPDTGAPATLSGTPAISAYVGNSTTQITAGITLTVDFDGVTGLNNVRVVATSGNGYTDNTDVALIITTGTVDAVSAVGYKVAEFTIGRDAAYTRLGAPAGASVSADIAAIEGQTDDIGAAGAGLTALPWNAAWDAEVQSEVADALAVYDPPTNAELVSEINAVQTDIAAIPTGRVATGTAQSATGTTLVLASASAFADDELIGATIVITGGTGVGQARLITDYVSATDTATVEAWTTTPSGTITYDIFGTAPGAAGSGLDAAGVRAAVGLASANLDTQLAAIEAQTDDIGTAGAGLTAITSLLPAALVGGRIDASVGAMAANVMTAAAAAADLTTELQAGLSTLDAAGVRTAVGLASANLDTQLADLPTVAEFNARTVASADYATAAALATVDGIADNLVSGIILGAAATGTLSTTQATSNLAGYADDQLIGRVIIWLTGACEGEASDITDYASLNGLLTFTALTTAPGNGDTFKVV